MMPKVITHNCTSLDGSVAGFDIDLEFYYGIAAGYRADTFLVGSVTAKTGIETFMKKIPAEQPADFKKPVQKSGDERPLCVIADTGGALEKLLHVYRNSGYYRDVAVLVSKKTPKRYIKYLKERNYDCILSGKEKIDFKKAFEILSSGYGAKKILTDSGGILNCVLIEKGLVDEISILVAPVTTGKKHKKLFETLNPFSGSVKFKFIKCEKLKNGYALLLYKVLK